MAPFNARHAFRAPCDEIALSFVLYHMTSRSFRTSVLRAGPAYLVTPTLKNGEGAVGVQKLNRVPIEVKLPPPTGGGQFFVLLSGHIELLDARCTAT